MKSFDKKIWNNNEGYVSNGEGTVQYTLTYAMGAYSDGGSVPDPVTVDAGSTVIAAWSPTPTRTGYGWSGWSTIDGASDAEYQMGTPIVMNSDITLYPVFIEIVTQYTLSYALNSQADSHDEDKLPESVTASEGTVVNVDFSTYPAPAQEDYDFIGWSTNEYGTTAEYSVDGTNTITMYSDVTLYPIYAQHIPTDYLAIDNTYGEASILVEWYDEDKATWKTSTEVSAHEYENFEYRTNRIYRISFSDGNFQDCVFTGALGSDSYVSEPCLDIGSGVIGAPGGYDWQFLTGVYYLTVSQPSLENKFTIVNNSNDNVEVYYENDKTEYGNTIINAGSSQTITIDAQYPYYVRYNSGGSTNSHWFNGVFQGNSFDGTVGYYDGNIQPPNEYNTGTEWQFYNNDYGTLTITYSR